MAGFFKKNLTLDEKKRAVEERIETLKGWRAKSDGEIAEKKEVVATLLGKLALEEKTEDRNSLRLAKNALVRMTETRDEYVWEIDFLEGQKKEIGKEFLEAEHRETPGKAETLAEEFNALLNQALETAEVLKGIHSSLQEKERAFDEEARLGGERVPPCRTEVRCWTNSFTWLPGTHKTFQFTGEILVAVRDFIS